MFNALLMHMRPYRNRRIMFFSGGPTSFAQQHEAIFPIYHSSGGLMRCQVLLPMVALVTTMVSIAHTD